MAINPGAQWPTQTTPADSDYPFSSSQEITVPGDNSGSPFDKAFIDDDWGWKQAALEEAGLTPSGVPDTAVTSQYLEAIKLVVFTALPSYADDTAAGVGGLLAGQPYKTPTGEVRVKV